MAEAPQAQPRASVERQRLGIEPENFGQHQVRRHFDRHCQVSYREDERPVHHEGSVVETHIELAYLRNLPLRGCLFHLAERYETMQQGKC